MEGERASAASKKAAKEEQDFNKIQQDLKQGRNATYLIKKFIDARKNESF